MALSAVSTLAGSRLTAATLPGPVVRASIAASSPSALATHRRCVERSGRTASRHRQRHRRQRAPAAAAMPAAPGGDLYLGMDFGTSGARATVVDGVGRVKSVCKADYAVEDVVQAWETALWQLLESTPEQVRAHVRSICIDGTSATAMLVSGTDGKVLLQPKLYNEAQRDEAVEAAKAMAPRAHTATASTSTLCKVLAWHQAGQLQEAAGAGHDPRLLHHADWLASLLHGNRSVTDWNNALKLGYDPGSERYPEWLSSQAFASILPQEVLAPGSYVGSILADVASRAGLPDSCIVAAGTTDSIAAFVAAGVSRPGQAVSSLGSSLAVKLLSVTRVDDAEYGVYSHRLGNSWLVGGASNTGGAVLRSFFTDDQLRALTERIDVSRPTGFQYYPLVKPGERFPVNDPQRQPKLTPRPDDDVVFLQGILESIARIEAEAYKRLADMGATPVTEVFTAGGGAANVKWTEMRAAAIGVPVSAAAHGDASYGSALLARQAALGVASTT